MATNSPQDPERRYFFQDALAMAKGEIESNPTRYRAGKIARLVDTLVYYGKQQHLQDYNAKSEASLRRRRNLFHHKLYTWNYEQPDNLRQERGKFISGFEEVVTGEKNVWRGFVTSCWVGSSWKRVLPLHVEAVVQFSLMVASGIPIPTKRLWEYRKDLAKAVGASAKFVEVTIRFYDQYLHELVTNYLNDGPRFTELHNVVKTCCTHLREKTGSQKMNSAVRRCLRKLEALTDSPGSYCRMRKVVKECKNTLSKHTSGPDDGYRRVVKECHDKLLHAIAHQSTDENARERAYKFAHKLAEIKWPLAELIAQFWDNVASMTYPICKFEHGKNRYIFRLATGELCTGTTIRPKLRLEELNAELSGSAQPGGAVKAVFRRPKPDLQVISSDYAIDCSVNVSFGRRRVLGIRERRALRVCMMLANYTKYKLDILQGTNGVFSVGGAAEALASGPSVQSLPPSGAANGDGAEIPVQGSHQQPNAHQAILTCNSPPDLISLLLCNQQVSFVSCGGIAVITGFVFRGQNTEVRSNDGALYATTEDNGQGLCAKKVRDLLQSGDRNLHEGSQSAAEEGARSPVESGGEDMQEGSQSVAEEGARGPVGSGGENAKEGSQPEADLMALPQFTSGPVGSGGENAKEGSQPGAMLMALPQLFGGPIKSDGENCQPDTQPTMALRSCPVSREHLEWISEASGSIRVLALSKSVYMLTKLPGTGDEYQVHELTDTLAYSSHVTIPVL